MKKYHLLDHKWQKIGLAGFCLCFVISLVCYKGIVYDLFPHSYKIEREQVEIQRRNGTKTVSNKPVNPPVGYGWAMPLVLILLPVSFSVMALSQEKQEDERIVEIRHQVLARVVILYIIVCLIRFLMTPFLSRLLSISSYAEVTRVIIFFTGVTAFMGYYVLLFKLSLWRQNRELSDEE